MAITHDQTGTPSAVNASTITLTWSTPPTAGAKVLVDVYGPFVTVSSVVDNGTVPKTFTQDATATAFGGVNLYRYRADGITLPGAGSYTVTVTLSGSAGVFAFGDSYLGVATGGPTSSNSASGTSNSPVSGSVTPAVTGALVRAHFADDSGLNPETISLTSAGWTSRGTLANGTIAAGAAADIIVSGTSAQQATWSLGDGPDWIGLASVYSPAGSSPAVAATWTGSYAIPSGFFFPFPSARPVQVPVTNTAGDWLFCLVAWRPVQAGSAAPSIVVADDAHNWWEPVGAPNTDSGNTGAVRTALWAAPAARVTPGGTTIVQVAATGPVLSLACIIADVSGILPWYQVAAISTSLASAATSLSVSAGAPSASAVLFAGFASDDNSKTITGPAGWTALSTVSNGNGVDHTADIKLTPAWQVTSGASTASVSSSGSLDLAGVIAGVIVSAAQPAQPNPNWPVMVTEAAIGSGALTPPAQMTWTALSGRSLSLSITQGRPYSLGALQAGQGTIVLDDPDGALIPPGTGSYAGIDSGTPLRRRVTWPPSSTPHYVAFSGFFRRWPWNTDAQLRGQVQAEITDAWGYGKGALNAMAIEECLLDSPHALWPMTDPAGSTAASNVVPNGAGLNLTVSKYGSGGASVTWGANSGALPGMSSAQVTASGRSGGGSGMFFQQLAGTSLSTAGYGYALTCTDPAFPAISGGVTIEAFAQPALGATQNFTAGTSGIFAVANTLPAGQAVVLNNTGGTFPTGVSTGTIYYVLGGGTSFSLSTTPGGSAVTISVAGVGSMTPTVPWNPVILAARGLKGTVADLEVDKITGALTLRYRTAGASSDTLVTLDSTHNYRHLGIMPSYSLAFNQNNWRVLVSGGGTFGAFGSFAAALPATFATVCFGGVMDRQSQGLAWTGYLALGGVYPGFSTQQRAVNRYWAGAGMGDEAACDRIERILEYAGMTGRRWLGQQSVTYEGDLCASGQDIGGQAAVSSMSNIAQSTLPAIMYVAPTGDTVYRSKLYTWNEPVKWTLGDNTAGGEIPFVIGQAATDYDPARVTADVQLTQLDTGTVTVPAGVMSATTMAAVAAKAGNQYGGQPYQNTGYLNADWSSAYNAGGSLQDLANWVQAIFAKPASRIQAVTVDAARHPTAWPFWAGASAGDMVAVNVRLPTAAASPLISLTARITQTARSSQFSQDGTSATITCTLDFAPEYRALICDDATRGKLDGSNVLPW